MIALAVSILALLGSLAAFGLLVYSKRLLRESHRREFVLAQLMGDLLLLAAHARPRSDFVDRVTGAAVQVAAELQAQSSAPWYRMPPRLGEPWPSTERTETE